MTVGTYSSTPRIGRFVSKVLALTLTVGAVASAQLAPAQAADPAGPVAGGQTASPADSLFPNQGNSGYDVSHYDIKFTVDVGIATTNGAASTTNLPDATATIAATTTGAPLSSYAFDFQGTSTTLEASTLNVESVSVNGAPASFSRIENTTIPDATTDVHKLLVTPATPVSGAFTTVVKYSGRPVVHRDTDNSIEGWNNTADGATFVNQPVGSMTLFPNNNTPRDKATYTWTVDAPTTLRTSNLAQAGGKAYQAGVVSNGELVSRTPSDDGSRTTWVWDQQEQMASELSFFSIGRYDIYSSDITLASGRTIPEWTFIDPALSVANQTTTLSSRAQLKSIIDFYETKYGPYPGNSTGLVTDNTTGINYALETQDRPFFPNVAGRGTVYHEMMHQWFGDAVSPIDWNSIWLSEGPAQYAEFQLPYEGAGSTTTTTEQANYALYTSRAATTDTWAVAPGAMTEAGELFGDQSYERGSLTLEALRTSIGAANFTKLMTEWQARFSGANQRTADFIALAEEISGRDLTSFFNTWIYTAGKPAWPVKLNLGLAGPTTQVNAGDTATYTLSARNTGKVAMPANGTSVTLDVSDVLDDAELGDLPSGITRDGNVLTWSVPATALAATTSVAIPVTTKTTSTGAQLTAIARVATLGGTCLDCASSTVVGTAPISPAPVPTITGLTGGAPVLGQTLTADTTGWAAGTSFSYQWSLDNTPVPGATSETYKPTGDVVGLAVTVKVTGTLAGFNTTSATSAATATGIRATPLTATPIISGTAKIGEKLTVDPGTWQAGTVFTYQWRANGANIGGATGPAYTPAAASQVGQTIDVVVSGSRFGYTATSKTSAATAAIGAGAPLSATPTPTLPGTPKVGTALTVVPGSWDDGVVLTYTWQANGTNITGATAASYTPTAAQIGQSLTVTVTGTKPGIAAVSKVSAAGTVEIGTQVLQPTPSIEGTPRAGAVSTGNQGSWDTGTTKANKWYADGVEITGATGTTYTPTIAQIGQVLTFEVTSIRPGYETVVKTSEGKTVVGQSLTLMPTPTISGTPKVGQELTVVPGTWDDGTTLAYQWFADAEPVDGTTGTTYTPGAGQFGAVITVKVTGTLTGYETTTKTSDPTTPVAKGDQVTTPTPTITGTPKVDVTLTAVPGTWDDGTTLSYQWFADAEPVDGATTATYTPGAGQLGAVITVKVTGTLTGYETTTTTSDPTTPVAKGDQVTTPTPTITGTPKVDVTLTAVPGTWAAGTTLAYQWFADAEPVDGATGTTYTPGTGQLGAVITVKVTGTLTGYETTTKTSDPTTPVAKGDQVSTPTPKISGTPKVDATLTATPGTWDDGVSLAYAWYAGADVIAGATGAHYVATPADLGKHLRVEVTGTTAGYSSTARSSDPTAAVVEGDQVSTPVPSIQGSAKVGVLLRAVPGSWDAGVTLSYQWLRGGTAVAGATQSTYTPAAGDVGATISVRVTGAKPAYTTVVTSSAATAGVAPGTLTNHAKPVIEGKAKVGRTLKIKKVAWESRVKLRYQWYAGGKRIHGATKASLKVKKSFAGKRLLLVVTVTKAGYTDLTKNSRATAKVKK